MARPNVFKVVVFTLAGTVLMVLGVGQLLADTWQVETSRTLAAPPDRVAAMVCDLGNWAKWSTMSVSLGPQTDREVIGAPGTVGQQIVWRGGKGRATLTLRAVAAGAVEYDYGYQEDNAAAAEAPSPLRGSGRIAWIAEGSGSRITWRDGGRWGSWALRWIGWFGAIQERAKQTHAASLMKLDQELQATGAAAK